MAFPGTHLREIAQVVRQETFPDWTSDPFREGEALGLKYFGRVLSGSRVQAEFQIVPLLIGLFWEVEHSAIYKPPSELRGITRLPDMLDKSDAVLQALRAFEEEFSASLRRSDVPPI
jgi:hypothetical protein